MCALVFKSSHRPHGRSHVSRFVLAGWWCLCRVAGRHSGHLIMQHQWEHSKQCARACSKVPIALMGFSHVLGLCLQGGGVHNSGGTVTISSCTITGNTASVRAHAQISHCPDGRFADALASTLSLGNCDLRSCQPVKYRKYVPQRPRIFPETLKTSHRPHGKLAIACCLQGGGVFNIGSSSFGRVTITSSLIYENRANFVRALAQKFPLPRWENC